MAGTPIEQLTAAEAFSRAARNRLRRYPAPEKDGNRLYPLADPAPHKSFSMAKGQTIFTIGSCFARNIEAALDAIGMTVTSRDVDLGPIGNSLGQTTNFFNKYSIHSILNELRWAAKPDSFPGEKILYPLPGEDSYFDCQLGVARLDFPLADVLEFRQLYLKALAQAFEADVIVVTLGYVETWYDTELDVYLNVPPPTHMLRETPSRFEFRVLSYDDVLQALRDLKTLLETHRSKPLKMLITVSPVPLLATFRDMDVLVANTYSKSVQRAALDQFVAEAEGVDYFPSYEFVTLTNPTVAWSRGDYRHVSPDLVARIMASVIRSYVEIENPEEKRATDTHFCMATTRLLAKIGDWQSVLDLSGQYPEVFEEQAELSLAVANAHAGLRDFKVAQAALEALVARAPRYVAALERLVQISHRNGDTPKIRDLLASHEQRFPARGKFRERWAKFV